MSYQLPCGLDKDPAGNLAVFLLTNTGSIWGRWCDRMPAKDQRRLFGRFIGKGRIDIDGEQETICNVVKVCFGTDWDRRNVTHWRDLPMLEPTA